MFLERCSCVEFAAVSIPGISTDPPEGRLSRSAAPLLSLYMAVFGLQNTNGVLQNFIIGKEYFHVHVRISSCDTDFENDSA